jgi:hypothetical protein
MTKGLMWLITVWGGFAVMAAAHKMESSVQKSDATAVRFLREEIPENRIKARPVLRNDIGDLGSLDLGQCGMNKLWRSLGMARVNLRSLSCGTSTSVS